MDAPAHFTGTPQLANGLWRVNIAGPAGSLVTIEASADLQNWSDAGQVVLTDGTSEFLEFVPPESVERFYRIQQRE